jgi:hypothetical protein
MSSKNIKKYNSRCDSKFNYNLIDKYNIQFITNNTNKYIILNNTEKNSNSFWCNFKIICSINNQKVLWANNMILIEKDILSNIKEIPSKKTNNLEDYILNNMTDTSIGIIKNFKGNITTYYEITKIIKT